MVRPGSRPMGPADSAGSNPVILRHLDHGLLERAAELLGNYPCVASGLIELAEALKTNVGQGALK